MSDEEKDRLDALLDTVNGLSGKFDSRFDATDGRLSQIEKHLVGDMADPDKPGLFNRVKEVEDDVESISEAKTWLTRLFVGGFGAGLLEFLWRLFKAGGGAQ
jgi:hypothetical protein